MGNIRNRLGFTRSYKQVGKGREPIVNGEGGRRVSGGINRFLIIRSKLGIMDLWSN